MRIHRAACVVAVALLGAGCSSASKTPAAKPDASTNVSSPTGATTAGSTAASGAGSSGSGVQFGGDVCTALSAADIEAVAYAQGKAKLTGTDTQKDAGTGQAVVCQYTVSFPDGSTPVAAAVSILGDSEFANRADASLIAPPTPVPGIGQEAYVVQPGPGVVEVWVHGANGYFKVHALSQQGAVALATAAAQRD